MKNIFIAIAVCSSFVSSVALADDINSNDATYYIHIGSEKMAPIANDRNIGFNLGRWNCIVFQAQEENHYISRELICTGPLHVYSAVSVCNSNVPESYSNVLSLGAYRVSLECNYNNNKISKNDDSELPENPYK